MQTACGMPGPVGLGSFHLNKERTDCALLLYQSFLRNYSFYILRFSLQSKLKHISVWLFHALLSLG